MWLFLIFWALSMVVVALLLLAVVRSSRHDDLPGQPVDSEPAALIAEEWLVVGEELCAPTECPRALGSGRRPRRDHACEVCATLFLERRWDRVMGVPPRVLASSDTQGLEDGEAEPSSLVALEESVADRALLRPTPKSPAKKRRYPTALALMVAGSVLVLGGATTLAFFGEQGGALYAGYGTVGMGLACVVAGARSGAI